MVQSGIIGWLSPSDCRRNESRSSLPFMAQAIQRKAFPVWATNGLLTTMGNVGTLFQDTRAIGKLSSQPRPLAEPLRRRLAGSCGFQPPSVKSHLSFAYLALARTHLA